MGKESIILNIVHIVIGIFIIMNFITVLLAMIFAKTFVTSQGITISIRHLENKTDVNYLIL